MSLIRQIRIQNRLAMSFAVLSLIPLTITGIFAYSISSAAIRDKISTYSVEVMDQASVNIQNELSKIGEASVDIAFSDLVQNLMTELDTMNEWEKNSAEMKLQNAIVKKFPFTHSVSDVIFYTNNRIQIKAYGNPSFKLKLKDDYVNDIFSKAWTKNGAPFWAIAGLDKEEDFARTAYRPERYNKPGVLFSRIFRSLEMGTQAGYIIIRMDGDYIRNIYKNINIGYGSDIFILDSSGTVVSSRSPDIPEARPYKNDTLIQELEGNRKNEVFTFNSVLDGRQYLIAYKYIDAADWYVISMISFSYLYQESNNIGIYIAVLGIVCFLLVLLMSYMVSKSISKPLNNLVDSMNHIKIGDFTVSIEDGNPDEIGEVTSNFNSMTKELKHLIDEVKSKETLKRIAELKTLQAQINPHFLSNTLNTVRWLANIQKAENISNIVTSLIRLLHGCMGKGSELVSIREEIDYVKNYINIMAYRYYDKFNIHFEIEEEILDYKILKFVLQPIVENSLIHGLEPVDGQGIIAVKGYKSGNELKISVTDNGAGISKDTLESLVQEKPQSKKARLTGIGIWNVEERIKLYFGEQYGITIDSVPNLFTTVEITIPAIEEGGAEKDV